MTLLTTEPTGQPPRALILACGNTYRGDDGVGWYIADAVEKQRYHLGLTIIRTRQLLPEHAEIVSTAEVVVFVDCSATSAAGTVSSVPIYPAPKALQTFTHQLDPPSLLRLTHDLYARIPSRAFAIAVGGESFECTDRIGRSVKAAIPKALEAVRHALWPNFR